MVNFSAFLLMYCSLNSVGSLTHIDTEATVAHRTQQSPLFSAAEGQREVESAALHSVNQFPETPVGRVLAEGKVLGGPLRSLPCAMTSTQQRELLTCVGREW